MKESSKNGSSKHRSKTYSKNKTIDSIKNKSNQNKKTPNRKIQNKYKRRRTFFILAIVILFIGIMAIIHTYKSNISNSANYMNQGNNYVINNKYKQAIDSYQEALSLDSSNTKAKDLIGILQGYIKADNYYNSGDITNAKKTIEAINPDYKRYPVGMQINGLKHKIAEAVQNGVQGTGTSSKAKDDVLELNNLYSSGQYKKALALIQQLNKENLNNTQQVYVSEINNNIEQKLGNQENGNSQFSTKGKYLNELDKINVKVNNMDLSAQTYDQKLQRAKNKYNVWNDELNNILQNLQSNLSGDKLTQLQSSEQNWIKQKEAQAVQSESQYSEQIVKDTANYQTQRSLTKDRCYYLVNTYM